MKKINPFIDNMTNVTTTSNDLQIAVLIDADNVPYKSIKGILEEVTRYGTPTIKRIYGDWTNQKLNGWKPLLLENAISPIQQYGYTIAMSPIVEEFMSDVEEVPLEGNVADLIKAMDKLMQRISLDNPFQSKVTHKELSVDERIVNIKERFKHTKSSFSFTDLVSDSNDIHVFVVSFLSILDLIRLNLLTYAISDDSEIWLKWSDIDE